MSTDTSVDMNAQPESEPGARGVEGGVEGAGVSGSGKKPQRGAVVRWVAVAAAAVMLAVGIVGFAKAHGLRSGDAQRNHALVDATGTAEVQSQVSQALVKVFSYDYSNPTVTQQAAAQLLAGKARTQYDTLFKTLQEKAPGQQLVLTAQVQTAAVKTLTDSTATLLVFLDQSSQRKSDAEASVSAAQIAVDATKIDGIWKVTGLDPL
jgi:Mce-associated membrane protein